jgi:hypothetical protein
MANLVMVGAIRNDEVSGRVSEHSGETLSA